MIPITLSPISESALVCTLPPPAELGKQQRLWAFAEAAAALPGVLETVAGMNNLTVFALPDTDLNRLSDGLKNLWPHIKADTHQGRHVDIPVRYGGEFGADLAEVAAFHRTTPTEIVGIGGSQTGVYPFASPGGWQLIGRTDIALFQTASYPPTLLLAGDTVRFVAEEVRL